MNDRFVQLAERALQLVADEHTGGDESRLNTDSYHVKDLIQEKFAELIVKECFKAAMIESKGHMNPIDLMKRMKERVGVE
jgi:hypothetical protein